MEKDRLIRDEVLERRDLHEDDSQRLRRRYDQISRIRDFYVYCQICVQELTLEVTHDQVLNEAVALRKELKRKDNLFGEEIPVDGSEINPSQNLGLPPKMTKCIDGLLKSAEKHLHFHKKNTQPEK